MTYKMKLTGLFIKDKITSTMNKQDYTEREWLDMIYQATQATYKETKRIRNNVLFFFWVTIIGIFFWVIAGGLAVVVGLASIGN